MFNGLPDCTDWSDECPTEQSLGNGDIFSSKYELIANPILRVVVWIMGIVALGGNLVSKGQATRKWFVLQMPIFYLFVV